LFSKLLVNKICLFVFAWLDGDPVGIPDRGLVRRKPE